MKKKYIRLIGKLKIKKQMRTFANYSGWDNTYLSRLLSEERKCPIGHEDTICKDIEEFWKMIKKESTKK